MNPELVGLLQFASVHVVNSAKACRSPKVPIHKYCTLNIGGLLACTSIAQLFQKEILYCSFTFWWGSLWNSEELTDQIESKHSIGDLGVA